VETLDNLLNNNYIYITRLASNEIFSPSNKIHREVGLAKDLSAPVYITICGLSDCTTLFPRYLTNGMIFVKSSLTKNAFWFSLQLLCATFVVLTRTERDINIHAPRSSRKVPLFLLYFFWHSNFLDRFIETLKYQISWKSIQCERSCFMHTDRQTWRS